MRFVKSFLIPFLIISALGASRAEAMQFDLRQSPSGEVVMLSQGPIVPGDTERFLSALSTIANASKRLSLMTVDSPGGSVAEARQIAAMIRKQQIAVDVPEQSKCASACFLLLAGSTRRLAAVDALIGVHSASLGGQETEETLAVTVMMQREAHDLGVPSAIVGKMAETTPGRIEWLQPADLALMQVTTYSGDLNQALRLVVTNGITKPEVVPSPIDTQPSRTVTAVSPAFVDGRDQRRRMDDWLASLRGDYREGAIMALEDLQAGHPASCLGQDNINRGDFTIGCTVASQKIQPLIEKLKSDANFASGWKASGHAFYRASPSEPVESEYRGVYFCDAQVGTLVVTVFRGADPLQRRALLAFGPQATSPAIPRGSFEVMGRIDPSGASLDLQPTKWVSDPGHYSWFGLSGESVDSGKTFSGRVTGSGLCTRFTLARHSGPMAKN